MNKYLYFKQNLYLTIFTLLVMCGQTNAALNPLKNFKVAVLVTNGFQEDEMVKPKEALEAQGATVHIISPESGTVEGWDWNVPCKQNQFSVDVSLDVVDAATYDALLLPGGLTSPDDLRLNEKAISFVKQFSHKPIAAICHGPWLLIDARLVKGKTITSYPSIKNDLINAGSHWVDKEVVCCENIVTSRSPEDIPAFCKKMIELFSEAKKRKQH